jgi:hypothetical protein
MTIMLPKLSPDYRYIYDREIGELLIERPAGGD